MTLEKTIANKYPIISSSANPENLSATFQSLLVMLIPLAIYFAKGQGIELAEADLVLLVEAIAKLIASVGLVYGIGRKLYYKIK